MNKESRINSNELNRRFNFITNRRKSMKKILTFFIIFLLLISHLSANPDADQFYISKEGDTFEKIAIDVYSKLPNSEAVSFNNRYRGILIYEENKDSVDLTIKFREYDQDPIIVIKPGEKLKIPIHEDEYPTVQELRARIDREVEAAKGSIKTKNTAISLQKISDETSDEIIKVTLSMDERGEPLLEEAVFAKVPYVLTDGTFLLQSHPSEQDIFVWQIIENKQAGKTIFLFPDTYSHLRGSYRKFGIMNEIARENSDRSISIFLESIDDREDSELMDKLHKQREHHNEYDFLKILTTPSVYPNDPKKAESRHESFNGFVLSESLNQRKGSGRQRRSAEFPYCGRN